MKTIVLSGINLHSGGTLSIYYDMLNAIIDMKLYQKYEIVCYVYKSDLFAKYNDYVNIIEISDSKGSYPKRLYYEYVFFHKVSKEKKIFVWVSVQDLTPNVCAEKLYTYCHNPMMFYKLRKSDIIYGKRLLLFKMFYKYVYKINIKKNTSVIVQQDWIRKEFERIYKIKNVLVARPIQKRIAFTDKSEGKVTTFIFASQATFFKNFEIICDAVDLLNKQGYQNKFRVQLTIDGTENNYSQDIRKKYSNTDGIEWLGLLPRESLFEKYEKSDCMVFPSRLETWGLPISEYKNTGKPIILSDLPYAHETIGSYSNVAFFDPDDAFQLSQIMKSVINGDNSLFKEVTEEKISAPVVNSWEDFWMYLLTS